MKWRTHLVGIAAQNVPSHSFKEKKRETDIGVKTLAGLHQDGTVKLALALRYSGVYGYAEANCPGTHRTVEHFVLVLHILQFGPFYQVRKQGQHNW